MKLRALAVGAAVVTLFGCASNQQAINRSMGQAESAQSVATEMNAKASPAAKANLDSAKVLQENGDEEEAVVMADMSTLEYKLAIFTAERDEAKKQDEELEKALRADQERKTMYQKTLEQAAKGGN